MALVLTFASIHEALKAEKALGELAKGGECAEGGLEPLPPEIKSDCGFGLFLGASEEAHMRCLQALLAAGIIVEAAYRARERATYEGTRKERSYKRIA
jgi:hypothetical protein